MATQRQGRHTWSRLRRRRTDDSHIHRFYRYSRADPPRGTTSDVRGGVWFAQLPVPVRALVSFLVQLIAPQTWILWSNIRILLAVALCFFRSCRFPYRHIVRQDKVFVLVCKRPVSATAGRRMFVQTPDPSGESGHWTQTPCCGLAAIGGWLLGDDW